MVIHRDGAFLLHFWALREKEVSQWAWWQESHDTDDVTRCALLLYQSAQTFGWELRPTFFNSDMSITDHYGHAVRRTACSHQNVWVNETEVLLAKKKPAWHSLSLTSLYIFDSRGTQMSYIWKPETFNLELIQKWIGKGKKATETPTQKYSVRVRRFLSKYMTVANPDKCANSNAKPQQQNPTKVPFQQSPTKSRSVP
ncbi:hypothetical protein GGX14DRAFT_394819 [Mycena pura]|uniref:Uncharacterized protein n=1 Tax=Mycena pura TaxID=153505 RepID=A0AAD6YD27_9AGAR|nr:hypothetical protein GGX14DRAFT_394819 [Mycena pura]